MSVTIRSLRPGDVPCLLDLIDGLADYEKLPRPDAAARERMARDATADPPRFRTLLAEIDGPRRRDSAARMPRRFSGRSVEPAKTIGYAIYFFTYSTFLARPSLLLEDIFVLPEHRGRGAGKALFRQLAAEAIREECGRMEWQVLDWNQPSIDFYERAGATLMKEWVPCRLTGDALRSVTEA